MKLLTSSKSTVNVNMDEIFGTVTKTWDTMFIPSPPKLDPGRDSQSLESFRAWTKYSNEMYDLVVSISERANQQEAVAQKLAEACVRQTKIIQELREELFNLKVKTLPNHKDAGRLPDHES